MDSAEPVRLIATTPPGRATRKARAFGPEIVRLRRDGYTLEAIRDLLEEAGLLVSKSTVHREAARQARGRVPVTLQAFNAAASHQTLASEGPVDSAARHGEVPRHGKDIAEAFMKDQITNPLMRRRMQDEDSRH